MQLKATRKASATNKANRRASANTVAAIENSSAPVGTAAESNLPSEKYILKLEEENRRLKLAVADLTLRNQALKSVVSKKW